MHQLFASTFHSTSVHIKRIERPHAGHSYELLRDWREKKIDCSVNGCTSDCVCRSLCPPCTGGRVLCKVIEKQLHLTHRVNQTTVTLRVLRKVVTKAKRKKRADAEAVFLFLHIFSLTFYSWTEWRSCFYACLCVRQKEKRVSCSRHKCKSNRLRSCEEISSICLFYLSLSLWIWSPSPI